MEFTHKINNNSITFINNYSKENPILNVDDECYFLFHNVVDIHVPLIGKGTILQDIFTDGIDKQYFIEINELYDNEKLLEEYFYSGQFALFQFLDMNKIPKYPKYHILGKTWKTDFLKNNLFRIEAFFIRQELSEILKLRQEYLNIIKSDLNKQILEINKLLI